MITVLFFIPCNNEAVNVFELMDKITPQLGYLRCEKSQDSAYITYDGLLTRTQKDKLGDIVEREGFTIMFIETEKESNCFNVDTLTVPTIQTVEENINKSNKRFLVMIPVGNEKNLEREDLRRMSDVEIWNNLPKNAEVYDLDKGINPQDKYPGMLDFSESFNDERFDGGWWCVNLEIIE